MTTKERIGLVGYYGWGNYGDELFAKSLTEHFPEFDFVFFHDPAGGGFRGDYEKLLESVSAIIIGGGDLLIPWYLSWLYWDERLLRKPIFIHGVGVPTWGGEKPEVMEKLRQFLSHPSVKHISCRDKESVEWVKEKMSPQITPVFYPDIVCSLRDHLSPLKQKNYVTFIGRANNPVGPEIIKALTRLSKEGFKIRHLMLGTGATLKADLPSFLELGSLPRDLIIRDTEEDMLEEIRQSSLVLSTKFHGCVTAFMCGIPSISLSRADKFTAFYSAVGLGDTVVGLDGKGIDKIIPQVLLAPKHMDSRREMFEGAIEGLNELGRSIKSEIANSKVTQTTAKESISNL